MADGKKLLSAKALELYESEVLPDLATIYGQKFGHETAQMNVWFMEEIVRLRDRLSQLEAFRNQLFSDRILSERDE